MTAFGARLEPEVDLGAMTERLGLSTVTAAWPAGVSQLAQAIDACERCDTAVVCADWLKRAPREIELPPAFYPNASSLRLAKRNHR